MDQFARNGVGEQSEERTEERHRKTDWRFKHSLLFLPHHHQKVKKEREREQGLRKLPIALFAPPTTRKKAKTTSWN